MKYGFPLLIITFVVTIAGQSVVGWVSDKTAEIAERTAIQMQEMH